MKTFEVKVFNAEPLRVRAKSVDMALEKAKLMASTLGLIIIGIRIAEVLA